MLFCYIHSVMIWYMLNLFNLRIYLRCSSLCRVAFSQFLALHSTDNNEKFNDLRVHWQKPAKWHVGPSKWRYALGNKPGERPFSRSFKKPNIWFWKHVWIFFPWDPTLLDVSPSLILTTLLRSSLLQVSEGGRAAQPSVRNMGCKAGAVAPLPLASYCCFHLLALSQWSSGEPDSRVAIKLEQGTKEGGNKGHYTRCVGVWAQVLHLEWKM